MEGIRGEWFGEDVGELAVGRNVVHIQPFLANQLAKEGNASGDVLHPFRRRVVIR